MSDINKDLEIFQKLQETVSNAANTITRLIAIKKERESSHSTEVEKKDWEIVSFHCNGKLFELKEDGRYHHPPPRYCHSNITEYNPDYGDTIFSVRRLIDGEVFSVRDTIRSKVNDNTPFVIEKIQIINNDFIYLDNCPLDNAIKLPKCINLFTTEDGVDIFIGDMFSYVTKDWTVFRDTCDSMTGGGKVVAHSRVGDKYFSSYDKAKQYVTLNKPCLSVNDILIMDMNMDLTGRVVIGKDKLKELAKQKLNQP